MRHADMSEANLFVRKKRNPYDKPTYCIVSSQNKFFFVEPNDLECHE